MNFSNEEQKIEYIVKNYSSAQTKYLCDTTGFSKSKIYYIAGKYNLKKDKNFIYRRSDNSLTEEQENFIIENYSNMTNKEISEKTNIKISTINSFACRKGLSKEYNYHKKYDDDFIQKLKEEYPFNSNKNLSKKFKIEEAQIQYLANQYNFPQKDKHSMRIYRECGLSPENKLFLEENYSNMKTSDIIKATGMSYNQIHSYASNHGLKKAEGYKNIVQFFINKRTMASDYSVYKKVCNNIEPKTNDLYKSKYGKYHINQNYFEKIDNEWKAYWLGFLYADGCVRYKKNNKNNKQINALMVGLQMSDKGHIQKMLDSLQAENPIVEYESKQKEKTYYVAKTTVTNKKIVEDLIKLGCVPNKSLILKFPTEEQVPRKYIRHFLRGYFDGDGCIHINLRKKRPSISFSVLGTKDFLNGFMETLIRDNKNLSRKPIIKDKRRENVYEFSFASVEDVNIIYNYLYKDCNIFLDRKLEKFDKLFCLD